MVVATKKQLKLTKKQFEILDLLAKGGLILIDSMNMASIGEKRIAPQTRYFLTDNRLVTRKDKTKAVATLGNGFIITPKGIKIYQEYKN